MPRICRIWSLFEKSFKALLEHRKKKIPKQHDLLRLKELIGPEIATNDDLLDTLNQLYVDSRYPGDLGLLPYGEPSLDDARLFYDYAKKLFDEVDDKLKA